MWDTYLEGSFEAKLQFALQQGLKEKKKSVAYVCLALLFADDPDLVEVASSMSGFHGDKVGLEMLTGALQRLGRDTGAVKGPLGSKRLGILQGLAAGQRDGAAYLQLTIRHLDGPFLTRATAIIDLHQVRPALVSAFGSNEPPSLPIVVLGPNRTRLTLSREDRKGAERLSKAWHKWFRACDKAKLTRVVMAAVEEYWRAHAPKGPPEFDGQP